MGVVHTPVGSACAGHFQAPPDRCNPIRTKVNGCENPWISQNEIPSISLTRISERQTAHTAVVVIVAGPPARSAREWTGAWRELGTTRPGASGTRRSGSQRTGLRRRLGRSVPVGYSSPPPLGPQSGAELRAGWNQSGSNPPGASHYGVATDSLTHSSRAVASNRVIPSFRSGA